MGQPDQINSNQINAGQLGNKLEDMFDNMQITVMGQDKKDDDSDGFEEDGDESSGKEDEEQSHF